MFCYSAYLSFLADVMHGAAGKQLHGTYMKMLTLSSSPCEHFLLHRLVLHFELHVCVCFRHARLLQKVWLVCVHSSLEQRPLVPLCCIIKPVL